jgi:hypothetical protein
MRKIFCDQCGIDTKGAYHEAQFQAKSGISGAMTALSISELCGSCLDNVKGILNKQPEMPANSPQPATKRKTVRFEEAPPGLFRVGDAKYAKLAWGVVDNSVTPVYRNAVCLNDGRPCCFEGQFFIEIEVK